MSTIKATAEQFFDACETGKGWEACQRYCHNGATFMAQAGALSGIDSLQGYTDWMKAMLTPLRDGRYEVRSLAVDEDRKNVSAYAVFDFARTGRPEQPAQGVRRRHAAEQRRGAPGRRTRSPWS